MKNILSILLLLIWSQISFAQFSLEGLVVDQNKTPLVGATVVLLDQDSTMVGFGISSEKGAFLLEEIERGDYIIQITYVSYANLVESIAPEWNAKAINLGEFYLKESSEILQEVEVKAEHIPMGIRGDTISYNTAAFKTKPGANVEDLLKKLPGIEVQRDGSIKAQGEDVEKVLVDGKEFFGDDPKIATQNLEAEAVDKVEVFDKQSEMAEFTGIEDGQDEKTINLKLKEDYKNGGFGKIELMGGTDDRYLAKGNYNRFSPRLQMSAVFGGNNINKQSFSFNDYVNMMGGFSAALSGGLDGMNFGELNGGRSPEGITHSYSGGVNFNYDFNKKLKWTSNYFYLQNDKNVNRETNSTQFTNDLEFQSIDSVRSINENRRHRINTKLNYKKNPLTQIVLKNNFGFGNGNLQRTAMTLFSSESNSNTTLNRNVNASNSFNYDGNIQLRKNFKKKGRNWSFKQTNFCRTDTSHAAGRFTNV
ncbi:MAG: carboxypeptidase regulatory-like domain-containing protein [Bacteroidota bacterium]